ncbi:site-2 protease family protein [Endozoicomonas sp. SM1973]|uniref:Site-2 protease family protein n=1 Tax=Spartinivicinus marinus TaxID=2994442 RepID=A0A853HV21_9GAMM|nr:site-2 protease family protein [Spartinivicinus marinus]MCX4028275.1 site-2 protease family protein [Spartinivicinus marinus]NYZ65610.1 site-2 protease family protein [Spartinivicinus marinus]
MLQLLYQGQIAAFILLLIAIVMALTFHEYGHALTAKLYGDDTAERMGRLNLNPMSHIDPLGLLMVAIIGFGYAKPVMTNPSNFTSRWASMVVAAAGPGMNLLLAIVTINLFAFGRNQGWDIFEGSGPEFFFVYLAIINLVLMIFNLIPLGPLDGHYILPYLLPKHLAIKYQEYNSRYGIGALLVLMALSIMGVPIFDFIFNLGLTILPYITFV